MYSGNCHGERSRTMSPFGGVYTEPAEVLRMTPSIFEIIIHFKTLIRHSMETYYLETDLEKIKALSKLREWENERFRRFLKNRNVHKTDILVHRLNEAIAPRIDCTACGNCCRELSPYLDKQDLHLLAEATQLPVAEAITAYTERDAEGGVSFRDMPCCFLKDNKCSIYDHRPGVCHSFPHLHKPDFPSRLRVTIENYAICPIIFNVIERMKVETGFE